MNPHNQHPSRRRFLKATLAGTTAAALAGPDTRVRQAARAAEAPKKAKACILLWMSGGPSQLDTVDPKPDAPAEIRGEFKAINTTAKGVQLCEHLPNLAKQADKLAIIRSMKTVDAGHTGGMIHMLTGFAPDPLGAIMYPWMGSVVAKYNGDPKSELPGCVSFGGLKGFEHPGEGFLGPAYQPLRLASHDAAEGKVKIACDIDAEWKKLGTVYGDSDLGRNCLAARQLVERGVPFVQVTHGGYDGHARIFELMKGRLAELDPAWSGLIADLKDRGLLDSTLVVWMGEFGRTPRINANSGRDHWAWGWSVVLAGGKVKGGVTYGSTDKTGQTIDANPVSEGDQLATIYTALGIDPKATNMAGTQAIPLTPEGSQPIKELVG